MRCFECNKNNDICGFVNITKYNDLETFDTGIRVFMCLLCINKILDKNDIKIRKE